MARVVSAALFLCLSSLALCQPSGLYDAWRWSTYGVESGLPSERTLEIAETEEGEVWVRTSAGLAWFDGFTWHRPQGGPLSPEKAAGGSLTLAPGRGVLICADGHLFHADTREIVQLNLWHAGRPLQIRRAAAMSDTAILVQTDEKLYVIRDTVVTPLPSPLQDPLTMQSPELGFGIWATKAGVPWLVARGGLYRWENAQWALKASDSGKAFEVTSLLETPDGIAFATIKRLNFTAEGWHHGRELSRYVIPPGYGVRSMDISPSGLHIALLISGETHFLQDGKWNLVSPLPSQMISCLVYRFRRNGDLWVGTETGLHLCRLSSRLWSQADVPLTGINGSLSELMMDSRGSMWIGTSWGIRIRRPDGTVMSTENIGGVPLGAVTGIAEDRGGNVWISSGNAFSGAFRWDGRSWKHFGRAEGLGGDFVHKIARDRKGDLWFLTISAAPPGAEPGRERGAFRYDGTSFQELGVEQGLPDGRVYTFAEDSSGALWFGTLGGISRLREGRWMRWSRKNGLRFDKIFTMTVGRDGRLWFGHQIGGLGYIDSTGTPRYITEGEGLINGDTWALAVDDRGRVWASTRAGIGCYNHGVWSTITTQLGLPSSYIWPILPLGDSLFIGTQGMGLAVFNFGELRDRSPVVRFGESLVRRNETIVRWSAASYWGTIPPDRILTRHRVDAEPWSEWSLTREVTLQASSGWGDRRVEVQAKGLLGEVTEPPASETVELPPPLVLRPYVLIPVGSMAALLAIGGFVAYRRKRRYDHELRVREHRYRVVVEQTGQIVYDYDIASGAISWSGAIRDVTGYQPEEFAAVDIRTWEEMIHPEDRAHVLEELERSQKSVGRFQMEYRFRHKHGHYIDVADNGLFIPDGTGNARRMLGAMNDISARKLAQEQIKESLREKEVLLKEIHHRVKNNLQVVSSLLNLQASTMTDPRAVEQLRESQHRIRTMALIHERLYQSQNLARIDFAEYLRSLVGYLSRSYNTGNVRLDIVTESVKLDVNLAIPCGLIVNELVSNALKHAFPDGRAGIVEVSLALTPERQCRIQVGDNGIGMPAEVNVGESKSLGLQLIHALIQQINATFEVERSAGTRITITFNPDLPA